MKRITALLILFSLLLPSLTSLSTYASEEPEQPAVTDPAAPSPVPDPDPEPAPEPTPEPTPDPDPSEPVDPPLTEPLPPETTEPPETDEPPATDEPPEPEPDYEALLFEALCAIIDSGEEVLSFSTIDSLEGTLLQAVCIRALEHVARFFYLRAIDVSVITLPAPDEEGNRYRYELRPVYSFAPGEELEEAKAYVAEKANAILAQIPENATRLEQLLFLHDYLCVNFAYDGTHTIGDLHNLLQSGHGVCQAYVHLYAYLLDQLGIPNAFAISDEMNHIWNIVELDGSWYHVDLTWDDPVTDQAGRALHTNFLRSDIGIADTGHSNWIAPHSCDSQLYEDSFLPDLAGAVLFLPEGGYAISRSQRALLQLDFSTLTATVAADLSHLRWAVWDTPGSLWKEQYTNLYYDGYLLYLNGPDSIWSFDPDSGELMQIADFNPANGYLYSLRGNGHTLTCTVSKAPGVATSTATFTTPHCYASEIGELFASHTCVLCGYTEYLLSPRDGDFLTACLSTRLEGEKMHDLRLLLLVDSVMLEASGPLTVLLTLYSENGERSISTTLSAEDHGRLLVYERIIAGGREYAAADGYWMLGLILRELENNSYDAVSVTITAEGSTVYQATLSADLLFPPPEPPMTDEPPVTDELPTTSEPPAADDNPVEGESNIGTEEDVTDSTGDSADEDGTESSGIAESMQDNGIDR